MPEGPSANNVRYCHDCNSHYTLDEGCRCNGKSNLSTKDHVNEMEKLMAENLSLRGQDWMDFSIKVLHHIETYAVPQYGDRPNDQITHWSIEECLKAIKKRFDRYGRNIRNNQQELDFLKMAHETQIAYDKYAATPVAEKVDNVCEWELDKGNNSFKTCCGEIDFVNFTILSFNFCPYCGKQIQVKS